MTLSTAAMARDSVALTILKQLGGYRFQAMTGARDYVHDEKSVVMTLGGAGALVSDGGPVLRVPAPRVSAVDTTGAGDAFVGALAARLADGVEDRTRLGACGLVVEQRHDRHHGASARMRAGPPVPFRCFGAPTMIVVPAAGSWSRLARFSIP